MNRMPEGVLSRAVHAVVSQRNSSVDDFIGVETPCRPYQRRSRGVLLDQGSPESGSTATTTTVAGAQGSGVLGEGGAPAASVSQ